MKQAYWVLGLVLFIGACKSQKNLQSQSTTTTPIDTLATESSPIPIDTINEIVENIILDSVDIAVHRLLPNSITITAVGDIMLGTNFPNSSYLPPNQGKYILSQISDSLQGDIMFGNLEGVILNEGGHQKKCNNPKTCYLFRSPEYMVQHLKDVGFDLLSVANNHAGDFGEAGRINTEKVLDSLNIHYAGNFNQPYTIFKKDQVVYGLAAFSPNIGTPYINDLKTAKSTVAHLDSICDITIVSFHGGAEGAAHLHVPRKHEMFYGEDRGDVYHFAHSMIDAGADIILGHGPHVPRAIELYKNRLIAYSLGNFATYGRFNLRGNNGLAPIITATLNLEGEFLKGRIIPAKQIGAGKPIFDTNRAVIKLIKKLSQEDFPEGLISIDESGNINYLHHN